MAPKRLLGIVQNTEAVDAIVIDNRVGMRRAEISASLPRAQAGHRGSALTVLVNDTP